MAGLARMSMPTAAGRMIESTARRPPVKRRRNAATSFRAQKRARSGVTALMTEIATTA